ncbi:MAG: hypothetical protein ACXWPS_23575, partial [Ktedonobacteraceae bacterium]
LRCAQGDKTGPFHLTTCNLCSYAQPPSPSGILDLCLRLMLIGGCKSNPPDARHHSPKGQL